MTDFERWEQERPRDFLEHAVVCTSQYDAQYRSMAAEILALRTGMRAQAVMLRDEAAKDQDLRERIASDRALIYRVVTGDGAQLENLDVTDDEWRALALDQSRRLGGDSGELALTLTVDDWLALVRLARVQA